MEHDPISDLFDKVIAYQRQLASTPDAKTLQLYLDSLRREWRNLIAVMTSMNMRVERILDELDERYPMTQPGEELF